MTVGPIQARAGKRGDKPLEEALVSDMHAHRDLGLPSVAAEVSLTDQQTEEETLREDV